MYGTNNNITYTSQQLKSEEDKIKRLEKEVKEKTEEDKIKRLEKEVKEKTEVLRLMKELKKLKEDIKTEENEPKQCCCPWVQCPYRIDYTFTCGSANTDSSQDPKNILFNISTTNMAAKNE
jgi:hypothetical protein